MANSDAYWSVPLVLAFECNIPGNSTFENEHDNHKPDNVVLSSGILGLTCGGGAHCQDAADAPIAATFTETIRDFGWTDRSSIKPTVPVDEIYGSDGAHEVFHTLSLWHNGGIMCSTRKNNASDPMREKITDLQVSILRGIAHPQTSVDRLDECGSGFSDPNCCPPPPTK